MIASGDIGLPFVEGKCGLSKHAVPTHVVTSVASGPPRDRTHRCDERRTAIRAANGRSVVGGGWWGPSHAEGRPLPPFYVMYRVT
jgi:hypothetical protein